MRRRRLFAIAFNEGPTLWLCVRAVPQCGPVDEQYRLKPTFIEGLRSSILKSIKRYWTKNKGASFQEIARKSLALKNIQSRSLSPDKPKPERTMTVVRKAHIMWIPHQALIGFWLHRRTQELDSKLFAQYEALTCSKTQKMDLMSTAVMDSVNCFPVFSAVHSQCQNSHPSPMPTSISKGGMPTLAKAVWATEEASETWRPQYKCSIRKWIVVGLYTRPIWIASNSPSRRLKSLIKVYLLIPPTKPSISAPVKPFTSRNSRKIEGEKFWEGIIRKNLRGFPLLGWADFDLL